MRHLVKSRWGHLAIVLGLALAVMSVRSALAEPPQQGRQPQDDNRADAFSKQEKAQIAKKILAHPELTKELPGHHLKILRVSKGSADEKSDSNQPPRRLADVILYDHSTGKAERLLFDPGKDQIVKREKLAGQPSPTEDELEEAVNIIKANPELAKLISAGGQITGGFLASPPEGGPTNDRYVQMQILTPDRRQIQRVVLVNLSSGAIAETKK
jgi:hypothetical protein